MVTTCPSTPPAEGKHLPEGRLARTVALELNPHHVEPV